MLVPFLLNYILLANIVLRLLSAFLFPLRCVKPSSASQSRCSRFWSYCPNFSLLAMPASRTTIPLGRCPFVHSALSLHFSKHCTCVLSTSAITWLGPLEAKSVWHCALFRSQPKLLIKDGPALLCGLSLISVDHKRTTDRNPITHWVAVDRRTFPTNSTSAAVNEVQDVASAARCSMNCPGLWRLHRPQDGSCESEDACAWCKDRSFEKALGV